MTTVAGNGSLSGAVLDAGHYIQQLLEGGINSGRPDSLPAAPARAQLSGSMPAPERSVSGCPAGVSMGTLNPMVPV
jgi:hypothetical protein